MHLRSIIAIARKDALDILLNRSTLVLLITPLMLAVLFVVIQNVIGTKTNDIVIYDPSRSALEQTITQAFSDTRFTYVDSAAAVTANFGPDQSHKSSPYALGLVIPANFDGELVANAHPQIQIYVNGDQISPQQSSLLLSTITDYTRGLANPQPSAQISVATINPPSAASASMFEQIGQVYSVGVLLSSLMIGTSLVPGLLAEEKEKKTLRMLMVTPASFADVIAGKLLVGLVYQLVLTLVALGVKGGYSGQVPLLLLFALLGACFSVSFGLLAGSIFQTTSAAGAFSGIASFIYILPIFFVGAFGQLFSNNPFAQVIRILPTYYIADGAANALQSQFAWNTFALDFSVSLGCILVLFVVAAFLLRRQASVAAII